MFRLMSFIITYLGNNNNITFKTYSGEVQLILPTKKVPNDYDKMVRMVRGRLKDHNISKLELRGNSYYIIKCSLRKKSCEYILGTIPPVLYDDREFILANLYYMGYDLISTRLKTNQLFNIQIIQRINWLNKLNQRFQNDWEIIMTAVNIYCGIFETLSDSFRDDKKIALAAAARDQRAYEFMSERLKNDRDIVKARIKFVIADFYSIPQHLQHDKEIILFTLGLDNSGAFLNTFRYAQDNKEIMLSVVRSASWKFRYASNRLKKDRELAIAAVSQNGDLLRIVDPSLQNDDAVVAEAVYNCRSSVKYANPRFREIYINQWVNTGTSWR